MYGCMGGWKLVISQNRPIGWIEFASKAQLAMKGFFLLIISPGGRGVMGATDIMASMQSCRYKALPIEQVSFVPVEVLYN